MTTGHAQDAKQPETGITPGDKGAFRDVLSKDHARRGKPPVHLVDMTPDERIARAKDLGLPKFRVKQLANHYFGRLETESEAFTDLPAATRGDIVEAFFPPLIDEVTHQVADQGTTIKTLWRLFDGSHIESVLMRYPNRTTLCISSQVGCGMGCPFCATGKLGLTRNMSTGEILEQVRVAARMMRDGEVAGGPGRLSNIVFMGMGEPMATTGPCYPPCARSARCLPKGSASPRVTSPYRPSASCPASGSSRPRASRCVWPCRCTRPVMRFATSSCR